MQSFHNNILSRIYRKGRGWVFTPVNFSDLGNRNAIKQVLARLTDSGKIRRLSRGLYDYPKKHPKLGELSASYDDIAKALAGKEALRIQPFGAYAANLLGLTEQVPAKIVFLTDGASRTILVGNKTIVLKKTSPKNMVTANRISGKVIQALRYLGKEYIDERAMERLNQVLRDKDKKQLIRDIQYAPDWIGNIFRKLAKWEG
ncbi:hypothetical protein MNBD_BACTEROID05-146 [hydrothermal vent metagenome]|uniref:Transcriptional regulator, AbiEi antitoxin, Type IV TA system n=1 Tax=hydrothermal vent metagenome TaxID=652676 RepID=A0A3B0TNU0_9ZZZZ